MRSYRDELDVPSDSTTPTFVAAKLRAANWRWTGVPLYLRTGKRLPRKLTQISIHFKPTPHPMFPVDDTDQLQSNGLTFRLQPEEGILHTFLAKQPGPDICLRPVRMHFHYDRAFGIKEPPSAYEWLLLDAMRGNQTLVPQSDWIYKAWSLVDPIMVHDLTRYPALGRLPGQTDRLSRGSRHAACAHQPGHTPHGLPLAGELLFFVRFVSDFAEP